MNAQAHQPNVEPDAASEANREPGGKPGTGRAPGKTGKSGTDFQPGAPEFKGFSKKLRIVRFSRFAILFAVWLAAAVTMRLTFKSEGPFPLPFHLMALVGLAGFLALLAFAFSLISLWRQLWRIVDEVPPGKRSLVGWKTAAILYLGQFVCIVLIVRSNLFFITILHVFILFILRLFVVYPYWFKKYEAFLAYWKFTETFETRKWIFLAGFGSYLVFTMILVHLFVMRETYLIFTGGNVYFSMGLKIFGAIGFLLTFHSLYQQCGILEHFAKKYPSDLGSRR